jgi:hypothetical protein
MPRIRNTEKYESHLKGDNGKCAIEWGGGGLTNTQSKYQQESGKLTPRDWNSRIEKKKKNEKQ